MLHHPPSPTHVTTTTQLPSKWKKSPSLVLHPPFPSSLVIRARTHALATRRCRAMILEAGPGISPLVAATEWMAVLRLTWRQHAHISLQTVMEDQRTTHCH